MSIAVDSSKPSICFVALNAYGILSGREDIQHIGGAEVQQSLIAHELVRRGYRVSFVTLDHGQPDGEVIDGITIYKAYRKDAGIPKLRFIHPRTTGLWAAMKRAQADVYYQRGAGSETGLVAHWCRRNGRQFVFAAAHDTNSDPALPLLGGRSERYLYRYGLARATVVIAQTKQQQALFRAGFGITTRLLRNCVEHHAELSHCRKSSADGAALWIGRISPEKRPEWLYEIARELPGTRFHIVGHANTDGRYARLVLRQFQNCSNITWHGYLPRNSMGAVYASASVLLCTSLQEGFPNVFLEAWARAIPVITTCDPDHVVTEHGLGRLVSSQEEFKEATASLAADPKTWHDFALTARDYVRERHSVAQIADRFLSILDEFDAASSRSRIQVVASTVDKAQ